MARTIYALLVGIDKYQPPVTSLRGCVNDINRVKTLLSERVNSQQGDRFEPLVLTDSQATRKAVIEGFRKHLSRAGNGDVALFYYSGHGSQELAPPEFWHLEPDKLNETLVCYDSRQPGGWDLADKELGLLIAEIAAKDSHVVIILDSCHSGSGTRDLEEVGVRHAMADNRSRPLKTYLKELQDAIPANADTETPGAWFSLPRGEHVVLSACRPEEKARELFLDQEHHGVLSYYLVDALQRTGKTLTYRDLFQQVNAMVRGKIAEQSPQIEASDTKRLNEPFLGGAIVPQEPYFTLKHIQDGDWVITGGAVHGLPSTTKPETTLLTIFPNDYSLEQPRLAEALGTAKVTAVQATQSQVAITFNRGTPDPSQTYKAIVTALPLTPLVVKLEGDEAALNLIKKALATANSEGGSSLLVREAKKTEAETDLHLLAADQRYRIRRTADAYPLVVDTTGFSEASAHLTVERLEHIARWVKLAELTNKTSSLELDAVQMVIYLEPYDQPDDSGKELRLVCTYRKDIKSWEGRFKVKLVNNSQRTLYCALLALGNAYDIYTGLQQEGSVRLEAGQSKWALDGEPIPATIPDESWESGLTEVKDLLKLIVSTEEFDARLLAQETLPMTVATSKGTRDIVTPQNTLDRLMSRVTSRALGRRPGKTEALADWMTSMVSIVTVRPLETAPIPQKGDTTTLIEGVTLQGHAGLKAQARLTTAPQASRDLGNLALPAWLRDQPGLTEPFEFTTSRGGEPGLSVLELSDIEADTYMEVTAENPLILQVKAKLNPDEHILPLGFDGEFFLPLGHASQQDGQLEIVLKQLPAPTTQGSRDPIGSIRILFQKVISQSLGLDFPYPILAAAELDQKGQLQYTAEPDKIKKLIKKADRIVIYVHGIFGDTRTMAASAWLQTLKNPTGLAALKNQYDLVLTFDYENLNTDIRELGRQFRERLEAVGLGPGHNKTVHIVAHSMGGLVSRWFIEREGGNQIVQHLIMVGTPNAGSPWPKIEDWALMALGLGLNSLASIAWPAGVLGSLLTAAEKKFDVNLNQMNSGSDFLKDLAGSPDPHIPYTILAGNTSIIKQALPKPGGEDSRIKRLMERLFHSTTNLAFFQQPNDIAVSVKSIKSVPQNRSPKPFILPEDVACDHISYFTTEIGLKALAQVLTPK